MGLVQLAGIDVIKGTICIPRIGVWHADLVIDQPTTDGLSGQIQLDIGGDLQLTGTAYRDGEFKDKTYVRFVAGAAGLGGQVAPKSYANVALSIPLDDVLKGAGETVAKTASQSVLNQQLVAWSCMAMPAGSAIAELMQAAPAGTAWRMLNDGTFWCGTETWPSSNVDYQLIDSDPDLGRVKIATDEPTLLPGVALDLGNVSYVEHHITPGRIRTIAWLESTVPNLDRIKSGWARFAASVMRRVDRYGLFRARVTAQSADLTKLDVIPDDPRLSQQGYSGVPLRHGLPGCRVQVAAGAYVTIGFLNGDPRFPYVHDWEGGESVQSIQLGGTTPVARKGDRVGNGTLAITFGPGSGSATLAIVYTPGDGTAPQNISGAGGTLTLKEKITAGSGILETG